MSTDLIRAAHGRCRTTTYYILTTFKSLKHFLYHHHRAIHLRKPVSSSVRQSIHVLCPRCILLRASQTFAARESTAGSILIVVSYKNHCIYLRH